MIKIDEKKKALSKELSSSTDVYRLLEDEIKKAILEEKLKMPLILKILESELNKKLSLDSLKKFVSVNKKKWLQEKKEKELEILKKGEKMKKQLKKVAVINFKGGVGKSTIANLLDLPNKVIVNLDIQDAKNSNYSDTINYLALKEEYGVSVNEATELLKEEGKEWIVFDTPGSITNEFLEIIDDVDYIIIPFTKGRRSKETTLETIKAVLEVMDNEKVKFGLILNMYQDENDIEEELKPLEDEVKKILGDKYKCSTALKFSKAVSTMEKTKKSIDELDLTNKIAYKAFKKRVKEMNDRLRECLFKEPFKPKIIKYEVDFRY